MRGGRGRIGEVAPGKLSVGEQPASERHLHLVLLADIYLACDDVGRFFCVLSFGLYLCRSASSSVSSRLLYLGCDDPDLLSHCSYIWAVMIRLDCFQFLFYFVFLS